MPFGLVFCFLLDYNMGSLCYWTALYCLCYALNGFQSFIDFEHRDLNSLDMFMVYIGIGIIVSEITHLNWTTFGRMLWAFIWVVALYLPITRLIGGVHHDR